MIFFLTRSGQVRSHFLFAWNTTQNPQHMTFALLVAIFLYGDVTQVLAFAGDT